MDVDRNDISFWFPPLEACGLIVPKTKIIHTGLDLISLLDGEVPVGFSSFVTQVTEAASALGFPCFLRTGHSSGKHDWSRTCFVPAPEVMGQHIASIVEWSVMADIMGLPVSTWAVREMIATKPLFHCAGFGDFPVTREFRLFVRDEKLVHAQPYWPEDALAGARPDRPDWRKLLAEASQMSTADLMVLLPMALKAAAVVGGGYWSVDLLEGADGTWWLTDMADGERSYKADESLLPIGGVGA